jgi:hypothetical protein
MAYYQVNETVKVSESGKGTLVKTDIPTLNPQEGGTFNVGIKRNAEVWVPTSRIRADGSIDPEWLGWKSKTLLESKGNGKKPEGQEPETTE